jgi:hypothetical protein
MASPRDPIDAAALRPTVFAVGPHTLTVVMVQEGRWTVGLDGAPPTSHFYRNQAEAWEAGVRLAFGTTAP